MLKRLERQIGLEQKIVTSKLSCSTSNILGKQSIQVERQLMVRHPSSFSTYLACVRVTLRLSLEILLPLFSMGMWSHSHCKHNQCLRYMSFILPISGLKGTCIARRSDPGITNKDKVITQDHTRTNSFIVLQQWPSRPDYTWLYLDKFGDSQELRDGCLCVVLGNALESFVTGMYFWGVNTDGW